jgi:hypothetical protein
MVYVSVIVKYSADLTQFMRVVVEDMRSSTLDTFKQDFNSNLPRQVSTLVQQINGEVQGKWLEGSAAMHSSGMMASQGSQGTIINVSQPNQGMSLNLQQPYYQAMTYGPNSHPLGGSFS